MKDFIISLEFQGLCLFDPLVLNNFIIDNKIESVDVLNYFIDNPDIGKKAIEQGIIVPIYSIFELDYKIHCYKDKKDSEIPNEWKLFDIDSFGLKVESNLVIISDIYAIISWDNPDFFLNYKENYLNKSDSNDYFELENGFYNLNIFGFREKANKSPFDLIYGYEFIFSKTDELKIDLSKNIDEIDYNVAPEELIC